MSDQLTPESNEEVVSPPKVTTPSSNVQQDDYEKRYKGLQRSYERLQEKLTAAQEENDKLMTELETLRANEKTLGSNKSTLEKELENERAAKANLESQLQRTSQQIQRAQFIAEKFPQLMPLEKLGSLPQADTTEELEQKLNDYVGALESLVGTPLKSRAAMAPPSPSGNGTATKRTLAQVYSELDRYAGSTTVEGQKKFAELRDELDELTK